MTGRVSSSLRQGIWMISFMAGEDGTVRGPWRARRSPGDRPRSRIAARGARDVDSPTRVAKVAVRRRSARASLVGLPGLPDVPELRLLLLAAVGPRGARPAGRRSSRASASRPSTRWRSRLGALLSLLGRGRRPRVGGDDARRRSVALVCGHLPARARRVHAARRRARRAAAAARASTSRSSPRAATSTSRTWRSSCGRRCWRRRARGAAGRCSCCSALAGLLRPGGVAARRPLLPVDEPRRDLGRARALRGAGGDRAAGVGGGRLRRHRRPAVLAALHELARPRTSARQRTLGEIPSALPQFFVEPRQAAGAARPRCWASRFAVWRGAAARGHAARAAG